MSSTKRDLTEEMMQALRMDMEDCRVAFVAGFGGALLTQKYCTLCDFCYQFGIPLDSLV